MHKLGLREARAFDGDFAAAGFVELRAYDNARADQRFEGWSHARDALCRPRLRWPESV
jgi:hypothetical protein